MSSVSSYEKLPIKERFIAGCLKCVDILCVWDCCWCWVRVQELVALIVFDPFMELFITVCIVINTLFMAMDHYQMDRDIDRILYNGNLVNIITQIFFQFLFFFIFTVFYNHFRSGSRHETNSPKSKILLSWRMEYIWFCNCGLVFTWTIPCQRLWTIRFAVFPFGEFYHIILIDL